MMQKIHSIQLYVYLSVICICIHNFYRSNKIFSTYIQRSDVQLQFFPLRNDLIWMLVLTLTTYGHYIDRLELFGNEVGITFSVFRIVLQKKEKNSKKRLYAWINSNIPLTYISDKMKQKISKRKTDTLFNTEEIFLYFI